MIFCFPFVLVFRIKLIVRLIGSSAYNRIAFHFSAGDDGDVKMGTRYVYYFLLFSGARWCILLRRSGTLQVCPMGRAREMSARCVVTEGKMIRTNQPKQAGDPLQGPSGVD